MDGQKVAKSGITLGGRDLSVIVFFSLVLVMFIIAFVEIISSFIWKFTFGCIATYIAWTFYCYITLKIFYEQVYLESVGALHYEFNF